MESIRKLEMRLDRLKFLGGGYVTDYVNRSEMYYGASESTVPGVV
jgi:hypothetical protein